MKMIFSNDEREAIYSVFAEIAQDRNIMMYPNEAKALGEVLQRTSGYRDREKFEKEHLLAIGYVLTQIIEENKNTDDEDLKDLLSLYTNIVTRIEKKLKDDEIFTV